MKIPNVSEIKLNHNNPYILAYCINLLFIYIIWIKAGFLFKRFGVNYEISVELYLYTDKIDLFLVLFFFFMCRTQQMFLA